MQKICTITSDQTTATFCGWVSKLQLFKKHGFMTIRDGPMLEQQIQVVITDICHMQDLCIESYVKIIGQVKILPPKQYSHKKFEIHTLSIEIIGKSDPDFVSRCPVDAGQEVRQKERHLYLRTPGFALMTRIRAILLKSIRSTLEKMSCTEIGPPLFVGTECESGASTYRLSYGKCEGKPMEAFLTQSSQFYLEYALPGVGDCYCIADSFRAESSHTRRHFTEFSHAEAEFAQIFTMDEHIEKMKTYMQILMATFQELSKEAIADYDKIMKTDITSRIQKIVDMTHRIRLMRHSEAIQYLRDREIYKDEEQKIHFDFDDDIPEAQERRMIDEIGEMIFLTHFPIHTKSFYMKADPEDPRYAWGLDVEVPTVGEIIGSGIRESDYDTLIRRMKQQGLKIEDYTEYSDSPKIRLCSYIRLWHGRRSLTYIFNGTVQYQRSLHVSTLSWTSSTLTKYIKNIKINI